MNLIDKPKTGVLIVNLGTPESTKTGDVRRYLRQFLMDGRVMDMPLIPRWMLVNLIIAPFRAPKSGKIYKTIWLPEGSPLKVYGYSVEKKLQAALGDRYVVKLAMRYQTPSIKNTLKEFEQIEDLSQLIVVPFFPQYASATTGSVHEEVMRVLRKWQIIPPVSFINSYYDHPGLIEGFAQSAEKQLASTKYDHYVFSYHGLPERQLVKAYPSGHDCDKSGCMQGVNASNRFCYKAHCYATTAALIKRMRLDPAQTTTCFQSRLLKDPWVQPYTEDVVKDLAQKGVKKVLAFSPAFVADCIETIDEVGVEYRDLFIEHGGEQWDLVESLNESQIWIDTLVDLVEKHKIE